ncbi:MAG: cytochrome c [Chitinophagaceae bacterium]|nr:cytochrome c [Chitinophagaceae bacterium]
MKKLSAGLILLVILASFQTAPSKKPAVHKAAAPVVKKAAAPAGTAMDRGKLIYTKRCLVCHQVDGGGVPHLNAPLDGASAVKGKDKAKLIGYVLKGFNDRVEIDGEYYSNNMAPLPDLSDQEIADVLTFVRNSWTNKASAVTAAEVKSVRAKTKK